MDSLIGINDFQETKLMSEKDAKSKAYYLDDDHYIVDPDKVFERTAWDIISIAMRC